MVQVHSTLGERFLAYNELLDVAALPQVLGKFGKLLMNAPHDLAVQFLRGRASAYLRLRRKVNLLRGIGKQLGMALKRLNRPVVPGDHAPHLPRLPFPTPT